MKNTGAHRTHCCAKHGCKYGEPDCPVKLGEIIQDHPCQDCDEDPPMEKLDLEGREFCAKCGAEKGKEKV